MNKNKELKSRNLKTIYIARASVICALYVALTYAFMSLAYGPIQIRIGEGLTILPLLFPESIPALYIGCMIGNIGSPYGVYDIFIGSATTLLAAICTYLIGKCVKNKVLKVILGGLPPVLFNAFILPCIWLIFKLDTGYVVNMLSILGTQAIFVYAVGIPLYFTFDSLRKKGIPGFEEIKFKDLKKKNKNDVVNLNKSNENNIEEDNFESKNEDKKNQ
ncbi:MAG: QueT transporter family protein [Clostridia bacterium]|nr:QueT transporter family protein [Clostridia bacterium]